MASSTRANSAAVGKRSAGDFAIARDTACSTGSGTVSRDRRSGGTWSTKRLTMIACGVLPVKGGTPASIS
jgi:hypothetical protein